MADLVISYNVTANTAAMEIILGGVTISTHAYAAGNVGMSALPTVTIPLAELVVGDLQNLAFQNLLRSFLQLQSTPFTYINHRIEINVARTKVALVVKHRDVVTGVEGVLIDMKYTKLLGTVEVSAAPAVVMTGPDYLEFLRIIHEYVHSCQSI